MLKLEHTLIYESTHADISPFLDKTVDELQEMRERSVSAEQLLFENCNLPQPNGKSKVPVPCC